MPSVSEGQLELLTEVQTRLDALHQAKLLTDDEIAALEDCVADYIDCHARHSILQLLRLALLPRR